MIAAAINNEYYESKYFKSNKNEQQNNVMKITSMSQIV